MTNKIKENYGFIIAIFVVFAAIFLFFASIRPVVPFDGDDWRYLSAFRHPLPDVNEWNPSRIFQEVINSLAGYFAAFIIYPFTQDYIYSITITTALFIAAFSTALYFFLYKLFFAFSKSKNISILAGFLIFALFFSAFKGAAGSQYMLYAHNLCTMFAYTLPNLLVSITTCIFMRYTFENTSFSIKNFGWYKTGILIAVIYFSIFSILFSALMLVLFCFFEILFSIILKKEILNKAAMFSILGLFLVYCFLEFSGVRAANSDLAGTSNVSLFSVQFLYQFVYSFQNLYKLFIESNIMIFGLSFTVIFIAVLVYSVKGEDDPETPALSRMFIICLLSAVCLIPLLMIICGKTGTVYSTRLESLYSIFFYYFLTVAIGVIYLIKKTKFAAALLPLILIILFVESTNSSAPFLEQDNYSLEFEGRKMNTVIKAELMASWIDEVMQADARGDTDVSISILKSTHEVGWPLPPDWYGEVLSSALFTHRMTSKKMNIITVPDEFVTRKWLGRPLIPEELIPGETLGDEIEVTQSADIADMTEIPTIETIPLMLKIILSIAAVLFIVIVIITADRLMYKYGKGK
ncbi:hypothetical protein FACS189447_04370 [Spirochaetia bacterium]|nr:hypothetical protein FACS189447_04370 [Spirochaetia bacterium]